MPQLLKVTMLMDKFLPSLKPGGTARVGYELSKALSHLNVEVTLLCRGMKKQIIVVNPKFIIETFPHYPAYLAPEVLKTKFLRGVDVVHAQTASAINGVVMGRLLRKPVVRHMHGLGSRGSARLAHELTCELSTRMIAPSEFAKETFPTRYRNRMEVVNHGVDVQRFKPDSAGDVASRYGLPKNSRVVLSVGRIWRDKGQHFVVQIMRDITASFPDAIYVNAGRVSVSPNYFNELQSLADRVAPGRIKFLFEVPQDDLIRLINLADVCVHPSLEESFGLAVAEEMSCGKPVIAFNNSSMPELIDNGRTGILVKTANTDGLRKAVLEVLGDTRLAARLGNEARIKAIDRFSWERSAREVISIYDEVSK